MNDNAKSNEAMVFKPQKSRGGLVLGLVIGGVVTAGLFAIIPLSQMLDGSKPEVRTFEDLVAIAPPDIPTFEAPEAEPPPEAEPEAPPEFVDDSPPSLDISAALPTGGIGAGSIVVDIDMNGMAASDDAMNMGDLFSSEDVDQPPKAVKQVPPKYPRNLQSEGVPGEVVIYFIVDEKGKVTRAEVRKATHKDFIKPALEAVKQWAFEPGMKDGRTVKTKVICPINFKLS